MKKNLVYFICCFVIGLLVLLLVSGCIRYKRVTDLDTGRVYYVTDSAPAFGQDHFAQNRYSGQVGVLDDDGSTIILPHVSVKDITKEEYNRMKGIKSY